MSLTSEGSIAWDPVYPLHVKSSWRVYERCVVIRLGNELEIRKSIDSIVRDYLVIARNLDYDVVRREHPDTGCVCLNELSILIKEADAQVVCEGLSTNQLYWVHLTLLER